MNRLISKGRVGEMILVHIDCFTKLGGNQYVNSTAIGNYEDYIVKEIIPYIDNNYNCQNRVVFGKSSGGYGSIMLGAHHPEVFNGVVDHSGMRDLNTAVFQNFQGLFQPFVMPAARKTGGKSSGKVASTDKKILRS
jgi:enterochelin esterase-like enzyme